MSESDVTTESLMDGQEPVRWLDDPTAASGLRTDLLHGATATAGGVDYGATLTALRGVITAQTGALAPAAIAGKSIGLKLALGGALAIGAAAAWWATRDDGAKNTVAVKHEPAAQLDVEPAAATKAVVDVARAPVSPTPAVAADPIPEPSIDVDPAPPTEPTGPTEPAEPPVPSEKVRKPKPTTDHPESDDDRFLREAQLVAQARKQLGTNPQQALASTRKHDREFPKGALVEEARALEIRALAKLGRMDDAQRKADDFLREFGDGAHASAVRRAIAGDDDVQ